MAQTGGMGAFTTAVASGVSLLVGGTAIELSADSIVSQSLEIMSVAKTDNIVVGLMVQLNPPGFRLPLSTLLPNILKHADNRIASWGGRDNPKPTERVKVTRDDGPKS